MSWKLVVHGTEVKWQTFLKRPPVIICNQAPRESKTLCIEWLLPQKILVQIKIVKNLVASKYTGELGKENDELNALHALIKVQMISQEPLKETPVLCRFRAKISETQTQGLIFLKKFFISFWLWWVSLLHGLFSIYRERGLLSGFSLWWLLLMQSTGSRPWGLRYMWHMGSVVLAPGLSCWTACGIFLDQGLNSCLLYWQVDSLPRSNQEMPQSLILKMAELQCQKNLHQWTYWKPLICML